MIYVNVQLVYSFEGDFCSYSNTKCELQKTKTLIVSGDANLKSTSRGKQGKNSSRNESRLWLWRGIEEEELGNYPQRDRHSAAKQKELLMTVCLPLLLFITYHYTFDMELSWEMIPLQAKGSWK